MQGKNRIKQKTIQWFHQIYVTIACSLQINLFQKPSFLHQLTHNMTRDCSLNSPKDTSSEHVVYKNCFFAFVLTFKTLFVHCMFYTCIFREFNEQSLVILWVVNWFKNESFWHRFICIGKKWIKKKYLNKFLPSSSQPWLSKEYCNLNKAARFKATSWI